MENAPARRARAADHRRAISRQTWLANRARNALKRPVFIGAVSAGTFVTALVSMVVVPRAQRQGAPTIQAAARPDTLEVASVAALARTRLAEAETSLAKAREAQKSVAPADPVTYAPSAQQDSLHARLSRLEENLSLAAQAPLPSSYKALAENPELRGDPRVVVLLDSLAQVEREREAVGATGGVDPIFVSLTARANEIGRAIQAIAVQRRAIMLEELSFAERAAPVAVAPAVDTMGLLNTRDSAQRVLAQSSEALAQRRAVSRNLDLQEERAREKANAVAPPLALLAAAFVLSAVMGFGFALFGELKRPRVSDATELERFLGLRVLSVVETSMPSVDRGRRQSDREAPPYFEPGAEGYQLAYLGLATEGPTLLMATITGDDPAITAVIGCNLAAVAADEARNTLVVDLERTCSASAALRARVRPGISDIAAKQSGWPDATVSASVGRNKTVDLVPRGAETGRSAQQLVETLRQDAPRLARYYDAILVLAGADEVSAGLPSAILSPDVVYCAQPGITPLKQLRTQLERIREAGGSVRGIVLWNAPRPLLATPRELADKPRQRARHQAPAATAAS
jgi:Mrp family chromosome partitioning ATPase